eukprot:8200677-Pyramimonas_sp.AAC.1
MPIGFWQDGAPANWDRAVGRGIFIISLPGQSGEWGNLRLPLTALLKRPIGEHAMDDVCDVIAYRFRWSGLGKHPPSRHDNKAWPSSDMKRKCTVGQALPFKAALAQMRGDWKLLKELFKLPRWGEKAGRCFRCWVESKEIADQVGLSAPWRQNRTSWGGAIGCVLRSGCRVNPLFQAPCASLRVIWIDWLHAADM